MNQQKQPLKETVWTFPDVIPSRPDLFAAKIVDKGISLQDTCGTDYAAAYLKCNRIGVDVAVRVLTHPSERRKHR